MAALVHGAHSIAIGVSGLHMRIVKRRPNHRLRRRNPLPRSVAFAPINNVSRQVRFRVRLPAQIDCGLRSVSPPFSPAVATAAKPRGNSRRKYILAPRRAPAATTLPPAPASCHPQSRARHAARDTHRSRQNECSCPGVRPLPAATFHPEGSVRLARQMAPAIPSSWLGRRRRQQLALQADPTFLAVRFPAQHHSLLAHLCAQSLHRNRRRSSEYRHGIRQPCRPSRLVSHLHKIMQLAGRPFQRPTRRAAFPRSSRLPRGATFKSAPASAHVPDPSRRHTRASMSRLDSQSCPCFFLGINPGQGYPVSGAIGRQIGHRLGQIQRWWLRRSRRSASREQHTQHNQRCPAFRSIEFIASSLMEHTGIHSGFEVRAKSHLKIVRD